jgi:hypothetical protein
MGGRLELFCRHSLAGLTHVVHGFFMQWIRLEFDDGASHVLLTRDRVCHTFTFTINSTNIHRYSLSIARISTVI